MECAEIQWNEIIKNPKAPMAVRNDAIKDRLNRAGVGTEKEDEWNTYIGNIINIYQIAKLNDIIISTREFIETETTKLPVELRKNIFKEISKYGIKEETMEHMKSLGIEIIFVNRWRTNK